MTRIVCSRFESKTWKPSDLCMYKSYCVSFPCALQDLYYCLYFSFSCFLLDAQQSSFWSIKIMSLWPILNVWFHYLSFWGLSLPWLCFLPWNHTSEFRGIFPAPPPFLFFILDGSFLCLKLYAFTYLDYHHFLENCFLEIGTNCSIVPSFYWENLCWGKACNYKGKVCLRDDWRIWHSAL